MKIEEFQKRFKLNNGCDRRFGKWQIIDIHKIPKTFSYTDEVDFYCCDNNKVYLLRLRNRSDEKINVVSSNNGLTYLIAELPITTIDNTFLEEVLLKFKY
ncbi:MAG: hypothetical protein FWD48_03425 [Oscillospiraceae bacterium]|nr:hypothetical protein [Oscillospiraceae bacterium]